MKMYGFGGGAHRCRGGGVGVLGKICEMIYGENRQETTM